MKRMKHGSTKESAITNLATRKYSYLDEPEKQFKKQWHAVFRNNQTLTIYQSTDMVSFDFHICLVLQNGELSETPLQIPGKESCLARAFRSGAIRCLDNTQTEKKTKDFIKKAANYLEEKYRKGDFSELILVSDAHQIKALKRALPSEVKQLIKKEIELTESELNQG